MNVYPLIFRARPPRDHRLRDHDDGGFLVGGWLISLELRRRGLNEEYAADITVAAVIGGIIGAKLWYWVMNGGSLFSRGGLVWYGGFIGGCLAVLINGWRLKVPLRWTLHICAPALAAAYALGGSAASSSTMTTAIQPICHGESSSPRACRRPPQ